MTLDAATVAMLRARPDRPPLHTMTAAEARLVSGTVKPDPAPPPVRSVERRSVSRPDGGAVPVIVIVPEGAAAPTGVLVYLHGGGWMLGSAAATVALGHRLAHRSGVTVVLVDYRLAPEHPYPAALDDTVAVLRAIRARTATGTPVVVGGDSAGANLATAACLRMRDEGEDPLAAQLLAYPVTDFDFTRASHLSPDHQHTLPSETMAWFWDNYLPGPRRARAAYAAPLRTPDLTGLPYTVLVTAEHDVLRDEGAAYADRLRAAGVALRYECFAGQVHGFLTALDVLPASGRCLELFARELRDIVSDYPDKETRYG